MGTVVKFLGIVALILFLIILGPLLTIWALNTLFPVLAIPYTFWTWAAALILGSLIGPSVKVKR
jgi:hypothetical protein